MCIRFITILDSTQFVIQFCTNRTRLSIFRDNVRFLVLQIINTLDRTDNSRRTASPCFLEGFQFFFRNRTTFHLYTKSSASCIKLLFVIEGRIEDDFGVM